MKKRLKSNKLIIIMVCAALVSIGLILLFFSLFAIYKIYEIDMAVDVADISAFNIDEDMVNFGAASPGGSSSRVIVMSHDYRKPLLVHFKKSGNISRFVDVPDDFYLEPGLSKEISLNAIIPSTAENGHFEGKLTVYFRRI